MQLSTLSGTRLIGYAAATIASVPVLVLYAVFQRRIIQGISMTGMGGANAEHSLTANEVLRAQHCCVLLHALGSSPWMK